MANNNPKKEKQLKDYFKCECSPRTPSVVMHNVWCPQEDINTAHSKAVEKMLNELAEQVRYLRWQNEWLIEHLEKVTPLEEEFKRYLKK